MRVRMVIDWPPEPIEISKTVDEAVGGDLPDLPRIPAGTFGTVTGECGNLLMIEFDGHDPLPFFRWHVEEIST